MLCDSARLPARRSNAFLAPTGRFTAGARNNVSSWYWTHMAVPGQSLYLTSDKRTVVTAFEMYEFHGTRQGTGIEPGDTFDLDYSFTPRILPHAG